MSSGCGKESANLDRTSATCLSYYRGQLITANIRASQGKQLHVHSIPDQKLCSQIFHTCIIFLMPPLTTSVTLQPKFQTSETCVSILYTVVQCTLLSLFPENEAGSLPKDFGLMSQGKDTGAPLGLTQTEPMLTTSYPYICWESTYLPTSNTLILL